MFKLILQCRWFMVVFDHLFCVSRAGTREVHNKLEKNRLVHELLVVAVGVKVLFFF